MNIVLLKSFVYIFFILVLHHNKFVISSSYSDSFYPKRKIDRNSKAKILENDDLSIRSSGVETSFSSYVEEDYPYSPSKISQSKRSSLKADLVTRYTSEISTKIIVSIAAAISCALLAHFLSLMLISYSSVIATSIVSIGAIFYTFKEGTIGDFCRSIGVLCILLFKRARFKHFVTKFVSQMKGLLMLGERRNFPPFTENPWKYFPSEGEDDVLNFKMMNTIIGLVLSGAVIGWKIAKQIPLLPGWIGAIGGASSLGYGGTLRDGRGDMLRFLGHSLHATIREISQIMDDVNLRETLGVVLGQIVSFLQNLDEKFGIMEKVQALLAEMMKVVKAIIGNAQSNSRNDSDSKGGRYRRTAVGGEGTTDNYGDNSADDNDRNIFGTRSAFEGGDDDTYGQGTAQASTNADENDPGTRSRQSPYRNRKKYSRT